MARVVEQQILQDITEIISDVGRIFEDAKLEVLSPSIFGLGRELRVLRLALHSIGDNPEINNRLMHTNGINSTIEHAEFVMRKIAADDALSRLIHDRTCTKNKYVNAFLPEANEHKASNIVADIKAVAPELSKLKDALYPPVAAPEEILAGMKVVRPESERFSGAIRDLAILKQNLQ